MFKKKKEVILLPLHLLLLFVYFLTKNDLRKNDKAQHRRLLRQKLCLL